MNRPHGYYFTVLILLLSLSGCYMKQVRHLAADIALLKVGETTQEDVVIFLGEPDETREVDGGVLKWLYVDKDESLMKKTPLLGRMIGKTEFRRAIVTFKDGIVAEAVYSSSEDKELDWDDEFSRQEKTK